MKDQTEVQKVEAYVLELTGWIYCKYIISDNMYDIHVIDSVAFKHHCSIDPDGTHWKLSLKKSVQ